MLNLINRSSAVEDKEVCRTVNKTILKWILTQQEAAVLYDLATATACKVKGFREITRNNIKQVRPQVMNELQKTTKAARVRLELRKHIDNKLTEEVVKDLRAKNQEELLELIHTKNYSLADILIILVTGDEDQSALADALFTSISEQGSLAQYEPQADSIQEQAEEPAAMETTAPSSEPLVRELEEQLFQERDKVIQLDAALKELREKRKIEVQEWKKERKTYTEEIKKLATELDDASKQGMEQEAVIIGLKAEVAKLEAEVKGLAKQAETKTKTPEAGQTLTQVVHLAPNKMKVVLLGEDVNESILNTPKFEVELVGNSQIEDFLQRGSHAEQIWMLSFQISPSKQRKLRNAYTGSNFKEFATLVDLQSYINKR